MRTPRPRIQSPAGGSAARDHQVAAADAVEAFQAASARMATVDSVTTELVRLRSARYHDCHR